MSIEQLLAEDVNVRRYVIENPSVRRFVEQIDPGAERCLAAMSGDAGVTLDDVCSCYESDEDEPGDLDPVDEDAQYAVLARTLGLEPEESDEERKFDELSDEERAWRQWAAFVGLRP
jgi:hypothetical protein